MAKVFTKRMQKAIYLSDLLGKMAQKLRHWNGIRSKNHQQTRKRWSGDEASPCGRQKAIFFQKSPRSIGFASHQVNVKLNLNRPLISVINYYSHKYSISIRVCRASESIKNPHLWCGRSQLQCKTAHLIERRALNCTQTHTTNPLARPVQLLIWNCVHTQTNKYIIETLDTQPIISAFSRFYRRTRKVRWLFISRWQNERKWNMDNVQNNAKKVRKRETEREFCTAQAINLYRVLFWPNAFVLFFHNVTHANWNYEI